MPLAHSFAKMLEIVAVRVGFCTAFAESIEKLVDNLGEVKPTFMAGVPRIYEKVYSGFLSKSQDGGAVKWKLVNWALGVGIAASREIQAGRKPSGLLGIQYKLADKLVRSGSCASALVAVCAGLCRAVHRSRVSWPSSSTPPAC